METARLIPTNIDWYPNYAAGSPTADKLFRDNTAYTYIGHRIEHPLGCVCAECALDEEWLKTDPHKGRPAAYTRDELRGLRGLVLGRVFLDTKRFWVRTCFWGADDTGIERDRRFNTQDEAAAYYERESRWLSGLVLADREVLLGMGFVWA